MIIKNISGMQELPPWFACALAYCCGRRFLQGLSLTSFDCAPDQLLQHVVSSIQHQQDMVSLDTCPAVLTD